MILTNHNVLFFPFEDSFTYPPTVGISRRIRTPQLLKFFFFFNYGQIQMGPLQTARLKGDQICLCLYGLGIYPTFEHH